MRNGKSKIITIKVVDGKKYEKKEITKKGSPIIDPCSSEPIKDKHMFTITKKNGKDEKKNMMKTEE